MGALSNLRKKPDDAAPAAAPPPQPVVPPSAPPGPSATPNTPIGSGAPATPPPAADQTPASFNQPITLGQTSIFQKPPDVSWGDWLKAKSVEDWRGVKQIGSTADNFIRAATDYMTGGLADRAAAAASSATGGIGGGDLAQQRTRTQQAHEDLGPADAAAFATGYGAGFGKLNPILGLAGYQGTRAAQEGTDPTSARIMTDPWGVGGSALGGAAEGAVFHGAGKFIADPIVRRFTSPDPANVAMPRSLLGFTLGSDMSAADVAKYARELTGVTKDDPQSFAPVVQKKINEALANATPEQAEATRQAYQTLGGDIPSGNAPPPSALRQGVNWATTALGTGAGGWLGHVLGFGLPEARVGGAALGGYLANRAANAMTPPPPSVYPALSGSPAATGLQDPLATYGYYYGAPALKSLLGLGP